jgi:hypothetical protein
VGQPPFRSLEGLLVKIGVVMMVVTMMMMGVYDHHNLTLRRIGHCEAEKQS